MNIVWSFPLIHFALEKSACSFSLQIDSSAAKNFDEHAYEIVFYLETDIQVAMKKKFS